MTLFQDTAGRPGPKDWIQGDYLKGQDDIPVTGVSWYEAAGKRNRAQGTPLSLGQKLAEYYRDCPNQSLCQVIHFVRVRRFGEVHLRRDKKDLCGVPCLPCAL